MSIKRNISRTVMTFFITSFFTNTFAQPVCTLVSQINVFCFSGNNGQAVVAVTGGTSPYTYSWNSVPVQTDDTAKNLIAGTYIVTVTDAVADTCTSTVTITQPLSTLTDTVTATNVSCFNGTNGTATATATGGTFPYSFLWQPGALTTATITGLSAGTYTSTVTDANGCTATDTILVSQPATVLSDTVTKTVVTCFNGTNGTATANVTGGTPPYSFSWLPVALTTATITGLTAGSYISIVTDTNGCTATDTILVSQPTNINISMGGNNVACNGGSNGTASAFVTGGTPGYSYLWSPGSMTTSFISGLSAGPYTMVVTDAAGCTNNFMVMINQPNALAPVSAMSPVLCFGGSTGSTSVSVTGGVLPYSYSWSTVPVQTNDTAINLSFGIYTCTITDNNSCISTATASVTQPAPLTTSSNPTPASCGSCTDGAAATTPSGGVAAYTFFWTPGGQSFVPATNLSPGLYTVNITDANGCTLSDTTTVSFTTGGINLMSDNSQIKIFPNPVNNELMLDIIFPSEVIVSNSSGEKFMPISLVPGKSKIDFSNFPNGIYFLNIKNEKGIFVRKIVKE